MPNKRVKVAVTGAAGQIGYAALFRIASGSMLGPDTEIELQLLELPAAMTALKGVAMELEDCAFPLLKNILITDDVDVAMRDANWVLLIGSVPRKAGMERADLLKINGSIFIKQGRAINEQAAKDVGVLVVGNPCNTNCLIAMHNAPDIAKSRFYAMTLLDENRAKAQLAKKAGVAVEAVKNMVIWGNHSATQYPDFYHAVIQDQPAHQVLSEEWLKTTFISTVQKRGAEVIQTRGASSAASAANAAINSVYHLTYDTPEDQYFSIGSCATGAYEVPEGLIFSFPSQSKNGQLIIPSNWEHNPFAKTYLKQNIQELAEEYAAVKALKLIAC